ncbi:TPA: glycosyltransferase family 4 protein [Candidatus Bathyarchaeota archaeon]|nr:glycosyltransferase family 4 protein [Candidatus Bathyarchaeota archaeon]
MRVIIFTWEYPPRVVGQLAQYTSSLATQLVKKKTDTYIVTYHPQLTGSVEELNGAKITRVANPVATHIGILTWVLTLNEEVERQAANIYYQTRNIDLIDVYDWHFIPAAVTLKNALGVPFIFSVDSIEDHRSHGANAPYNMAIKGIEWLGFYECSAITVKSEWMCDEIKKIYNVPEEKIRFIAPNKNGWITSLLKVYTEISGGSAPK